MAGIENIFKPSPGMRPRLACEIRSEGVTAARASAEKRGRTEMVLAFAPLAPGALTPGLKVPNLADAAAVAAALRQAVDAAGARDRNLTVVVPDAAARVLLLDFDTLPARRHDALPVVKFRLRKMVPFDVEAASVSYQIMSQSAGEMSVLVTVMPGDVLAEYESAAREAGYEPSAVLPSTLAAAAALSADSTSLLVNQSQVSVTTAVTQGNEMLLHRTIDLSGDLPAGAREEEMAQAVITTLAWYEDTLRATPDRLFYAGPGGAMAARQSRWLRFVDPAPPVEDVVAPPHVSSVDRIPEGLAAGVTGALAR